MFAMNDWKNADFMEGMTITRKENSLIEIVHKGIFVPEKKIIMPYDFNEDEIELLKEIQYYKGGLAL